MDSLFWFFRLTVYIMVIMLIIWLSYYHGIMKQLSRVQSTLKSRYEGDWAKNPQGPHLVMHSLLGQLRSMCSSTWVYWRCFTFKSQPVAYWEKWKHWEKWPLSLHFSLYSMQHLESSSGPTVKRDNTLWTERNVYLWSRQVDGAM